MAIKWKVDPMHSEMQFQVRHLMISKVTGNFNSFDLEVETETEDFNTVKSIVLTTDIESINTNNEQRDAHLKSADFFNVEEHATLNFVGNNFESFEKIQGDLTIKGITKPVAVNVEFGGIVTDPYGQTKAGFTVTGTIKRKDFGLTWDAVTEAGKIVLSDDIKINAEIQLTRQN
jgi:polyisoprenoid-binding protein YceI